VKKAVVVSITPKIAILAVKLGKEHRLPMADSIIYVTAKIYDAEVYTQDKHFKNLERVFYFGKESV